MLFPFWTSRRLLQGQRHPVRAVKQQRHHLPHLVRLEMTVKDRREGNVGYAPALRRHLCFP